MENQKDNVQYKPPIQQALDALKQAYTLTTDPAVQMRETAAYKAFQQIKEGIAGVNEAYKRIRENLQTFEREQFDDLLKKFFEGLQNVSRLKDTGVLQEGAKAARWLRDNANCSNQPSDSAGVILKAAERAAEENKNLLSMLPLFKKEAQKAQKESITADINIYDLLRQYALKKYDIDAPVQLATVQIEKILYPLDTVNSKIWTYIEQGVQHPIKAEKNGSDQQLSIYYSIDFDALGDDIAITQKLTSKDKRIYIAARASADENGNTTLTKIHKQMGNTGRPSAEQLAEINNLLTKMGKARITVNNKEQAGAYNYPHFVYDGSLLPFERVSAVVNGKITDAAIHLLREPPLITFARQRKQVTTIDAALLQSPVSKTDANLDIEDYLITRISREKKSNKTFRILYNTLFERAQITTAKQKQRAPQKIKAYLDHYKTRQFIFDYFAENDGVTICFTAQEAEKAKKAVKQRERTAAKATKEPAKKKKQ